MSKLETSNYSGFKLIVSLWRHIGSRRKKQFFLLLILTLLSSFAEILSLSSVLPFIGTITQSNKVTLPPKFVFIIQSFGITSQDSLIFVVSLAFAFAALLSGGLRLLLLLVSIRLGNATGADLSIEVYNRTLYQKYSVHISRSSSEIITGITQKVGTATSVLLSLSTAITSTALFFAIIITLIVIDPIVALVAAVCFGIAYGLIAVITKARLVRNSHCIAHQQTQVIKSLQEGLGAIRDVLLEGAQKVYCTVYQKAVIQLQRATSENAFINQAPRFAVESLAMVLIAVFVLLISRRSGGVVSVLPVLAVLALGAQRLLPLMQQLYGNWSVVMGNKVAMIEVLALLEQPLTDDEYIAEPEPLSFKESIKFVNVSFDYGTDGQRVLDNINLLIRKGARIGFIGETGSGKSTAIDLLMGLLEPKRGEILVDGIPISKNMRAWQRAIAHVPQSIFISDTTISENIAFGVPFNKIDHNRVRRAAEQASISQFIESGPYGYNAIVGERGVRLSGGQRQRIGIARALYKRANVIIFDEATSALDNETEHSVMEAIEGLGDDLTIIIIAHRLTTLASCTDVFEIKKGAINNIGLYKDVVMRKEFGINMVG